MRMMRWCHVIGIFVRNVCCGMVWWEYSPDRSSSRIAVAALIIVSEAPSSINRWSQLLVVSPGLLVVCAIFSVCVVVQCSNLNFWSVEIGSETFKLYFVRPNWKNDSNAVEMEIGHYETESWNTVMYKCLNIFISPYTYINKSSEWIQKLS